MRSRNLILLLLVLLLLHCGDKSTTGPEVSPGVPEIAFSKTRFCQVWDYQHYGWYIDSTGTISSFSYSIEDSMEDMEKDTLITPDELARIRMLSEETGKVVPYDTLMMMCGLIEASSSGTLSERTSRCKDYGVLRYAAYIWDDARDGYRIVPLYQAGDWAWKNDSEAAAALYRWLMSIDGYTSVPCSPDPDEPIVLPEITFGKTRLNFAWGYDHYGWFVDSSGTVRSFDYQKPDTMWLLERDTLITLDELARIYARSVQTDRVVPRDSLVYMCRLTYPVSTELLPEVNTVRCRDYGLWRYHAYIWDSSKDGYRILTLYQAGDESVKSESVEGQILYRWLMSIDGNPTIHCTP